MASISPPTLILIASLAALPPASVASAAFGQTNPVNGTDPIKGVDAMGDKNRSGPDGWVQAPITRDQAPAATTKAAGETKTTVGPATASSKTLSPGEDPGTPIANPAK